MTFPKGKRSLRAVITAALSVWILVTSAFVTGCTEDEADAWLNEIFGMLGYEVSGDAIEGDARLKMHVIDVGQGDAVLMQCGGRNVLIDCGENGMGDTVLDYLRKADVSHLDWIIGTHPHSDHIGGMDTVDLHRGADSDQEKEAEDYPPGSRHGIRS